MKITNEQWEKIKKLNESVKDLNPILKERIIDIELYNIFKEDYVKLRSLIKKEEITTRPSDAETKDVKESFAKEEAKTESPNLRDFYNEKKPSTELETVTVFSFYLEHFRNIPEFTEKEISNCYFEARARKPKVIGQSLRDAKNNKHYLVEGSKKGKFRISNTGENLVMHDLPRTTAKK